MDLTRYLPTKMPSSSPQQIFLLKIAAAFLTLLFILLSLLHTKTSYKSIYDAAVLGKKSTFVKTFLESEYGGHRMGNESLALKTLCARTKWVEGIIFLCEPPQGGMVNVRNAILNCVRLAIEVGATGLILPTLLSRPHPNLPPRPRPLAHFFSTTHFTAQLSASCPLLTIYNSKDDLWDKPSTATPIPITPSSLFPHSPNSPLLSYPDQIPHLLRNFINESRPSPPVAAYTKDFPIILSIKPTYLFYPPTHSPPSLASTFSNLLIPSPPILSLSATILYALSQKHKLSLNPLLGIQPSKFYTAHLRTGPDAQAAGWTPFAIQSANYFSHAKRSGLRILYIAVDEGADGVQDLYTMAEQAKNHSMVVASKEVLLGGPWVFVVDNDAGKGKLKKGEKGFEAEWQLLETLELDQKVAVDLEVLGWGSVFGGVWESMGSWGVGGRRHFWGGGKERVGNETRGGWEVLDKRGVERRELGRSRVLVHEPKVGEECFSDGLSVIFGPDGEGRDVRGGLWG